MKLFFLIFTIVLEVFNLDIYALDNEIEIELPSSLENSNNSTQQITNQSKDSTVIDSLSSNLNDDSTQQVIMPQLTNFIEAEYPDSLIKKGIEGEVIVDMLISDSGKVDSVAVIKGLHSTLDSLAKEAIFKFSFTPAMLQDSTKIPVILQYAYKFSINKFIKKIQEYVNLKGTLKEKGTRNLISDATISITYKDTTQDSSIVVPFSIYLKKIGEYSGQELESGNLIAYSNEKGEFSFKSLPVGKAQIKIIATGYKPYVDIVDIENGKETTVNFWLTRDSYNEYEIVTYGTKEKKEVAKRTLQLSEIKQIPGVGGDALKVIQTMPGVARPSFTGGAIVLRGANTEDSKYYLDGIVIPRLYHFGGLKSVYNSEALKGIDFYPGGFNSRYGDAIAGVIELHSREPKTDRLHGYADVNLLDASFMVEGPINSKFSTMLTARRSYFDQILKTVYENVPFSLPFTVLPYYWDYVSKSTYKFNINNRLDLTLFGSLDYVDILSATKLSSATDISDQTDQLKSKDYFHEGSLQWIYKKDSVENTLNFQLEKDFSNLRAFGFFAMEQHIFSLQFRDQFSYKFNPILTLNSGCEYSDYIVDYNIDAVGGDGLTNSDTIKAKHYATTSIYANSEIKPIPKLLLIPGVRVDYYHYLNHKGNYIPEFYNYKTDYKWNIPAELSLRLTTRYELNKITSLKGAIGSYNQSPRPVGMSTDSTYGNPNLTTSKSAQYVVGAEHKISDLDFIDVQLYYNNIWDLARQTTIDDYKNSEHPEDLPQYLDNGKGRSFGLEIYLKHNQSKHFMGWVSYTLSRSERWNFALNKWSLFSKDQTHNLQLLASWRLKNNWTVGTRVRYTTGNPQTPIIGTIYNEDRNRYESVYGEYFSTRVDPFFQIDLRAEKKVIFKRFIVTYYIDIQNASYPIYKSPENYIYNYDKTERDVVSSVVYPAIGTKIEF